MEVDIAVFDSGPQDGLGKVDWGSLFGKVKAWLRLGEN